MDAVPRLVSNPPNPYHSSHIEWIDAPPVHVQVYEENARSIIATNDSPDIDFEHSVNPYRGCFHGCAYCYARPSHQYLQFGAGTDFERKLVVKRNAPLLLRKELAKKKYRGKTVVFSGNTDCYQPLEASYELTRECLKVCRDLRHPIAIITKGALVRRDIDVLADLSKRARCTVFMSIAFADDEMSKLIEPGAPRPSTRFRALEELSKAGIYTGVALAPLIPGLNDAQIPEILERARSCGAKSAFMTLLRLPGAVKEIFFDRISEHFPNRFNRIEHALKDMRGGVLNRSDFGDRMVGKGPRWESIEWLFRSNCERLGLNKEHNDAPIEPQVEPQLELFG